MVICIVLRSGMGSGSGRMWIIGLSEMEMEIWRWTECDYLSTLGI